MMPIAALLRWSCVLVAVALAPAAQAHSFGEVYYLPLPFERYAWAAAAALVVSFVIVALFASGRAPRTSAAATGSIRTLPATLVMVLQAITVTLLLLSIATGWLGTRNPYANFNMTLFWVVFVLGYAYLTLLIGDLYTLISPWRTLAELVGRAWPAYARGFARYPAWLGVWPAVVMYLAFIWVELFGHSAPRSLATVLAAYTVLNLVAAGVFGTRDWFRHGEFFAVLFGLIARMSPVAFAHEAGGLPSRQFRLRWPFAGVLQAAVLPAGTLMFILAMLAATAFDGLHETEIWHSMYWLWLYPEFLVRWVGDNPFQAFPELRRWYGVWQSVWLFAAPWLYLLVYGLAVWLMARLTGGAYRVRDLAVRFAPSLLPIVLVYHVTHYYTLLQVQGPKILALASDPFGWGHDWFGTAGWLARTREVDVYFVWNAQVFLILLGHVISVYLAHVQALRMFPGRRTAGLSQLPMLALMVGFTVFGLWILSQPFQGGR
jgi:hypothetical protein